MKLVVCGKGGSGKRTVSALMARESAARGEKVLVVDTERAVSPSVMDALQSYDVQPIPWSKMQTMVEELTA